MLRFCACRRASRPTLSGRGNWRGQLGHRKHSARAGCAFTFVALLRSSWTRWLNTRGWLQKRPVDPASIGLDVVITCPPCTSLICDRFDRLSLKRCRRLAPFWGKSSLKSHGKGDLPVSARIISLHSLSGLFVNWGSLRGVRA